MIDAWDTSSQLAGEVRLPSLEAYLLACQEPFQREAPALLDALFERLDDALYDLADKSGSDRLYSRYFDAMRLFRKQSRNIKAIFLRKSDGGNAVQAEITPGTKYSFREHLDSGHIAWSMRRLGKGNELRPIFLAVLTDCLVKS